MGGEVVLLRAERLSKRFGPVQVLFDISLELRAGEVHALIGENGAGKSTLMKILSGTLPPTSGVLSLDGRDVTFGSSEAAEAHGIVLIHQEFNLAEDLPVHANIFLGREIRRGPLLALAAMRERTRALLAELETSISPDSRVRDLAVADKQMVEIAKALARDARILILDEPTAVLTEREARVLFRRIERLRAGGAAILYTSHKLDEVRAIANRVTVLRDGRLVKTATAASLSEGEMARLMVGREVSELFPAKQAAPSSDIVLEVEGWFVPGAVHGVAFRLRRGEILGFGGLIGAGRTELMEGLVGLRASQGQIRIGGRPVRIRNPGDAKRLGLAYLTEDRKNRGLLLARPMRPNLTLLGLERFARPLIDRAAEQRALDRAISEWDIRAPRREAAVGDLSGGNQQKLLLAKTMLIEPDIVIIDEPTRGIDIGTRQQIYGFVARLAALGKSIIVVSSEMAELIGLCHRVVVMRGGRIAGELEGRDIEEHAILRLAMGLDGPGREPAGPVRHAADESHVHEH